MTTKGYFIITDISGYTEFLTRSELDHAQEILQSLFDAQIECFKHPFVISGFRGDAIFAYAPETTFIAPQSFLEALELIYFVFADTLRQMQYNTNCQCRACKNMSNLDLKMCIHYGEYAIQKLGDREELLGADVIVPHRMLKNQVIEKTGIKSYALFSETAADALNLSDLAFPLTSYTESYEHLGEVKMQILDLRDVWRREQERHRFIITPETAWLTIEDELPFPPSVIWEYITVPALEKKFTGYETVERTDELGGRTQPESSFHCAHGELNIYNRIVDWKPFDYYTVQQKVVGIAEFNLTRKFTPIEEGTKISIRISEPAGGGTREYSDRLKEIQTGNLKKLRAAIEVDLSNGKITIHNAN